VRGLGKEALPSRSSRKIGPHKIRHTAITAAVRLAKANGLAREDVQRFSRHKDFRMVARYLDADDRAQGILARANGARLA
jgi:integrase